MLNDSLLPKHAQLRAALLKTIDEELQPGAMIPSERDLTTRYDVSRATVRAAISSLVNEGRLTTVPGRGTVVTRPRVESNLHLASFTQDMRQRGHRPSTEVLTSAVVGAGEATAKALGVSPGDRLWEIERLRLADDEPMAHEVSWYPEAALPGARRRGPQRFDLRDPRGDVRRRDHRRPADHLGRAGRPHVRAPARGRRDRAGHGLRPGRVLQRGTRRAHHQPLSRRSLPVVDEPATRPVHALSPKHHQH